MIAGLFDAYSLLEIGTYKPSSVVLRHFRIHDDIFIVKNLSITLSGFLSTNLLSKKVIEILASCGSSMWVTVLSHRQKRNLAINCSKFFPFKKVPDTFVSSSSIPALESVKYSAMHTHSSQCTHQLWVNFDLNIQTPNNFRES